MRLGVQIVPCVSYRVGCLYTRPSLYDTPYVNRVYLTGRGVYVLVHTTLPFEIRHRYILCISYREAKNTPFSPSGGARFGYGPRMGQRAPPVRCMPADGTFARAAGACGYVSCSLARSLAYRGLRSLRGVRCPCRKDVAPPANHRVCVSGSPSNSRCVGGGGAHAIDNRATSDSASGPAVAGGEGCACPTVCTARAARCAPNQCLANRQLS